MTGPIELNLITGRTVWQGVAIEGHKHEDTYTKACGIIEMDVSDLKRLRVFPGQTVKVRSDHGEVIVKAVKATQGPHPGLAFIPMGPWANQVIDPKTYSTGMPHFKGVRITVEPAPGEKVLNGIELLQKTTLNLEKK
ncbi:molybdopterin dinucleotide-binding protein [Methanocella sp. CWC-04]|uniref:Molybdopterin dinucleotide-binding protein n=1 Tax=Methanooceanicella nereidis TaxID=2052831 RepID=A0AAP2RBE2_9EURY|nr:molybdopterin dinucleotide binding domain-containing protein [Methanocella sp. CWC-04]MCD1294084.1 molybdopterin dinucleotide-binding protein [Methanocella sp. CWC-04]